MSVLWAASRLTPAIPFPPISTAHRLIRLTPGAVATDAIEELGHLAQPAFAAGVTVAVLVLLTALAVLVRGTGRLAGVRRGAVFFALLVALSYLDPEAPRVLPVLAASAVGALAYARAWSWAESVPEVTAPDPARRRAVVELAGAVGGIALGGTLLGSLLAGRRNPARGVTLAPAAEPARAPARPTFPSVPGLSPEVTAPRDHYVVDIDLVDPLVDARGWRLRVSGRVGRPLELGFADLQRRFRLIEEYATLTCVSNPVGGPLIGNSTWTGVRLADVLAAAGVRAGAVDVLFRCADGYTVAIPLERAREPTTLLAIAQGGRPLRQEHGFPCRVRVPSLYGMMNAKWVEEVVVLDRHALGYWQQRGWSDTAVVRTESRIDTQGPYRAGAPSWIAGVAWAGTRGISRVEVSTDGGASWSDARLNRSLSPVSWTQWAYRWTPPRPGSYPVQCRAIDGSGDAQERRTRAPHPSGASGYHQVELSVS